MHSYRGYHADLYDLFYSGKNYKAEAAFVHDLLRKHGSFKINNLLELACGTGNHSFYLAQKGYSILATDNSRDMLRIAKKKLDNVPRIEIKSMNMLSFKKFKTKFDATICLFDSIGYVQSNENIFKVLCNVRKSLQKDGLFIFEFWNAGAMLRSFESKREKVWRIGEKKIIRKSETKLRYAEQLADVTYSILEYKKNKLQRTIAETQTNRYFLIQEMKQYLNLCGLKPLKWLDGFTPKEEITENVWHIVCVSQKK